VWWRTPIRAEVRTVWQVQLPRDALLPRLRSRAVAGLTRGAPRTYTPKHLAKKILTSRAAVEGERKQVTGRFKRGDDGRLARLALQVRAT
jgi:hypothetical protein